MKRNLESLEMEGGGSIVTGIASMPPGIDGTRSSGRYFI